jgi:hypothetical protein
MRFLCRFGIHSWRRWQTRTAESAVQFRECEGCGVTQKRRIV